MGPSSAAIPDDLLVRAIGVASTAIVVTAAGHGHPVLFVNREFSAITGYSVDEVMGRSLAVLQGPLTDARERRRLSEALEAGLPVTAELLNYRKDGEPFWMRVQISPVPDPLGRIGHFVGSLTDLTEQRQAENAVRESEERLRALTEALPLPMIRANLDGVIEEANASAHETLGVPPGQLTGRSLLEFHTDDDDTATRMCGEVRDRGWAHRVEMPARRLDGTAIWLLVSGQLFTVHGQASELIIFQDLTELKRRERELTEANERAERTILARMRFLAAASHDLRQPLQALALFASAMDAHVQTPQARAIVQSMKASLRGMEEMFDSLLDMSKLDAGVMKAEPGVFLIGDIFERLEAEYGPLAEAAGLRLRLVPTSATVRTDPRMLARILGNFLSNAIRYTREGRILIGCRPKGSRLRIEVHDTGPGIPESQRLEIFNEFCQGSTPSVAGRGGGMGLGLAIVQRLARLLGHPLSVRSVEGRGSVFAVEVPLSEEWLVPPKVEEQAVAIRDVAGATVVVVDDDPDIQDGLRMLLDEWRCRPVVAATAADALAELDREGLRPDVILADLHLSGRSSGVTSIQAIRERAGTDTPAFLFTGDTEAPPGLGENGVEVLRKPIDPMRLRATLADALGR